MAKPTDRPADPPSPVPLGSKDDLPPRVRAPRRPVPPASGLLPDQFDVIRRALDAWRTAEGEAVPDAPGIPPAEAPAPPAPVAVADPLPTHPPSPDRFIRTGESKPGRRREPAFEPVREPVLEPAGDARDFPVPTKRRGPRRTGRGQTITVIFIACALVFCAGVAVYAVTHRQVNVVAATPPVPRAATPDTVHAAAWIASSVGPAQVVACDVSVCQLLRGQGFPASSLVTVRNGLSDVEQADAVVLTPVLRAQLGAQVNAIVSPEPLAVFGSGADRVEIAAVALDGPGAYAQSLSTDHANRRTAGNALLGDKNLVVGDAARALLAAGLVDTRVCALLALLSGSHTIVVGGFSPIAPGAGPDIPSAGVVITSIYGQGATGQSAPAAQLLVTVHAQQDPYLPMSAAPGRIDGERGLRIIYSQPGPLGLLTGATS